MKYEVYEMKALVYHGPGRKVWEEVPKPTIKDPADAIVKIETTTICGTDLHILKGDVPAVTDGRILGHEGVGVVTEVGSEVGKVKVGDRVIVSCISKCMKLRLLQGRPDLPLPDPRRHRLGLRPPH